MSYNLDNIPLIAASLNAEQNECAITLALKIADDSCKMDDYERSVFMKLYDALPEYRSDFFDDTVFELIAEARTNPSARIFGTIKPLREAGMAHLGRPAMKAYKAAVREALSL